MSKAVLLDRDGVINKEVHHLKNLADLRILPGVANAIRHLNENHYQVIVIANQGAVAKGIATIPDINAIHQEIRKRLARRGAKIDAFYFCPHHPEGAVKEYAIRCACRKPETGMIEDAMRDFGFDSQRSFLVGDKTSDILAGQRSGLKTILVKTGYGGSDKHYDVTPDFVAKDLLSATKHYIA